MRKSALVLLLFILLPTTVFAQNIDPDRDRWRERRGYYQNESRFELTLFGGYRYGGTLYADTTDLFGIDLDVESGTNWGGSFGVPVGDTPMKIELMINRQNTHLTAGSGLFEPDERVADFDITYYHAGVQFPFVESRSATPFIVLSAGFANLDPRITGVSDENRFSASAGIGVKVPFNRNIGLRVEARGYFTSLGNYNDDDCFRCDYDNDKNLYQGETNVGLVIRF